MQIGISISDVETKALRSVLNPRQYMQAMNQATQRTTRKGRVMAGDAVRSRLTLRKKFIDDPKSSSAAIKSAVTVGKPTTGKIVTTKKPLPLSEFKFTAGKKGVTVTIDKTRPPLLLRHAFKATVASKAQAEQGVSHTGIFERRKNVDSRLGKTYTYRGKKYKIGKNAKGFMWRIPIEERRGPSVFDLVKENEVLDPLVRAIGTIFRDELGNQISRFTGGRVKSLPPLVFDSGDTDQ